MRNTSLANVESRSPAQRKPACTEEKAPRVLDADRPALDYDDLGAAPGREHQSREDTMRERFGIYMRLCRQNGPTHLNHPMWFRWIVTGK